MTRSSLLCLALFTLALDTRAAAPPEPSIPALIQQLGDDAFAERQAAHRKLEAMGFRAVPWLRRATSDPDLEIRGRVRQLLLPHTLLPNAPMQEYLGRARLRFVKPLTLSSVEKNVHGRYQVFTSLGKGKLTFTSPEDHWRRADGPDRHCSLEYDNDTKETPVVIPAGFYPVTIENVAYGHGRSFDRRGTCEEIYLPLERPEKHGGLASISCSAKENACALTVGEIEALFGGHAILVPAAP